jgi:hypothetical protein
MPFDPPSLCGGYGAAITPIRKRRQAEGGYARAGSVVGGRSRTGEASPDSNWSWPWLLDPGTYRTILRIYNTTVTKQYVS